MLFPYGEAREQNVPADNVPLFTYADIPYVQGLWYVWYSNNTTAGATYSHTTMWTTILYIFNRICTSLHS